MSNDQRLHFEYVLPGHALFSEVNLQPPRPLVYDLKQDEQQNSIVHVWPLNTEEHEPGEEIIPVDSDETDFAPNSDGELTAGCRKCGVDYGSSTELKLHFGAVHCRQTFECCVCNKLFLRRHGFLVHIKRYHEDVTARSFPCPFCEQIYTHELALTDHVEEQHKDPNLICPLCLMQVPEGGMKKHVEKEHVATDEAKPNKNVPKKAHKCEFCAYETNRAERLRVHILGVHQNERAFQCDICKKGFKQKDKLTRHVSSVHLQEKPFSCDFCSSTFARKDELSRHISIVHYGQQPKFTASLPREEVGSQKQPQTCPHCSYNCERPDKMKAHIATVHSDERPYVCHFCEGKSFKLKDKLNLHINTVHLKRKPHSCQYCNQAFGRRDAAKRHEEKWCGMRPKPLNSL